MKPNQAVTERFSNNLIRNGRNSSYELLIIKQDISIVDDITVGVYYTAIVGGINLPDKSAVGATPSQAVRRALEKHGVTFR